MICPEVADLIRTETSATELSIQLLPLSLRPLADLKIFSLRCGFTWMEIPNRPVAEIEAVQPCFDLEPQEIQMPLWIA